jgi:hypothetical protein
MAKEPKPAPEITAAPAEAQPEAAAASDATAPISAELIALARQAATPGMLRARSATESDAKPIPPAPEITPELANALSLLLLHGSYFTLPDRDPEQLFHVSYVPAVTPRDMTLGEILEMEQAAQAGA